MAAPSSNRHSHSLQNSTDSTSSTQQSQGAAFPNANSSASLSSQQPIVTRTKQDQDDEATAQATTQSNNAEGSRTGSTTKHPLSATTTGVPSLNQKQSTIQLLIDEEVHHAANKKPPSLTHVLLSWKYELVAALFAIGLLVCEIVVLVHYDGKYLFEHWSHTWSINSVFAFLTTFLEAGVMFYVAACMGQLRWHWFRKKQHRLDWLEIMSDAQRPSGAMKLLFRPGSHRQFAVVGAIIVLCLLGVNTFTQQVITEITGHFALGFGAGAVPINTNYTWYDSDLSSNVGTQQPVPNMVAAIQNGFYGFSSNLPLATVDTWTSCSGDSCDFGKYQSIAVCSACADITHNISNPCPGGHCADTDYYTLPNGTLSLLANSGILNITSDTNYTMSSALSPGPLIVRTLAMVANSPGSNGTGAQATECAAWWCVKTYQSQMINNTLKETVLNSYTDTSVNARSSYGSQDAIPLTPPECWVNNTKPSNSSYCTYWAGAYTQVALQNFLTAPNPSLPFPAFLTGSTTFSGQGDNTTFNYPSLLAGGLLSTSAVSSSVLGSIKYGFAQMADQMTVNIRSQATANGGSEYSYSNGTQTEPKFHVRWGWLAYPIAIVVISLIFMAITIWITRRDESWKSSILPILFHSFGGVDREDFVKLDTVKEMRWESKRRKVSLGHHHGHSEFRAGMVKPWRHGRAREMSETAAADVGGLADIINQAQN